MSGNGANADEKKVAIQMADNFIEQMHYPRMKTQVMPTQSTQESQNEGGGGGGYRGPGPNAGRAAPVIKLHCFVIVFLFVP